MDARLQLKAEIWVQAYMRQRMGAGLSCYVARRGDADAGAIFVKIARLDGTAEAFAQTQDETGGLAWRRAVGGPAPEGEVDAFLARQAEFDPDIWVVEVEDPAGEPRFIEPLVSDAG
ncbi:MAG: DUF1491 family protein [Pseudomonadota bacterium]